MEESQAMITIDYSQFKRGLDSFVNKVTENQETILITRKDNQNVVMISEKVFNDLLEKAHLTNTNVN